MQNPWLELPAQPPYVLDIDRDSIARYNNRRGPESKVNVESVPEPFIGNPQSARVVLLNLNPGDSDDDRKAYTDAAFRGAMGSNLRHERQEYAFYPLNPKFAWTPCARWWRAHTRELLETGLEFTTVAERLLVIEWFPYHSKKSALPVKRVCPSQDYSFQLAMEMLEKRLVIRMRSKKQWVEVDPRFRRVPFLKNPQNPCISIGNCGEDLFKRIVKAFQEN
jgi:hypothetical protein